jgi:hypothetical protein
LTVRRRALGGLVAAALLVVACSTPEPNGGARDPVDRPVPSLPDAPDADGGEGGQRRDATLTGRILGPDGAPLAGAAVTVVESRSSLGLDDALAAVFTLGIACISSALDCSGDDRVVDSGTTDGEGRYSLTLPDAYLPGFETDEDWVLQVGRAPVAGELTGPSSSYELEVNTEVQEAPDLALWDGTPMVTATGGLLEVAVPSRRGGPPLENLAPRFVDDTGDVVWGVEGTTVDPRLLEDRSTRFVSSGFADVAVQHDDGRTIYHEQVATATVPYVGALVPLSRAKPCTRSSVATVGCPFTDGDLAGSTELAASETVTVDLGAPAELGLVVVRGIGSHLRDDVVVEVSEDGTTWTELPHQALDGTNGWSAGRPPGRGLATGRYVRVGAGSLELAEVSVWPPTEAERAAATRPPSVSGGAAEKDDDVPWPLAALAGALALAVAGAGLRVRGGQRRR